MVYELRAGMHGDVIVLGASSWRVEEIGHDRVTVSPAPGVPGKLPFWKGDAVGRPIELGRALGAFVGELEGDLARGAAGRRAATTRLRETHDLDELAADNLLAYLDDEREATGALPTDKRIVVERFRDELGDWRLCILSPFGGRVHAPWSLALEARLGERLGLEVQTIWSDDGIAIRLPEGDAPLDGIEALLFPEPDEVEDLVVGQLSTSALFASRFRENAARALLLPRRRPGTRTPLWQQRQRSADLLAVASRYGSFPILVETYRECLSDVFDLPALREILGGVARREIAVHGVETVRASPFAGSLLFDYVAAYMYDGDTPIAERRAGALTLDRDLLRELLGQEELRELLDPDALADLELSLQALAEDRRATTLDGVHDLLRRLGDLSADEVAARTEGGATAAGSWLEELATARRAVRTRIAGDDRWIAIEDVARYRDGVGDHRAGRRARGVPRAGDRRARRAAVALRPDPRPVPDARPRAPLGAAGRASSRMRSSGCSPPARSCVASSGRAAPNANGAIPRSCGCSAVARSPDCGARSSRSTRRRSRASCRTGRASPRSARPARRSAPRPRSSDSPRWSTSSPGCRSRPRSSSATSCRRGSPATSRACSTSWARSARSPGSVAEASAATTGGSPWSGPGARSCGRCGVLDGVGAAIRAAPPSRSASTWPRAAPRSTASCSRRHAATSDREVLDALWDLVWAGEVTNDTFAPLRALRWKRSGTRAPARRQRTRAADRARSTGGRRPLVARRAPSPAGATDPTERLHAQSLALLDRHGVLTREAVATEGIEGGFAAVYPVLRAMEEAGRIRRGYFVDGLGAAQFALAGRARPAAGGSRPGRAADDRCDPPAGRRRPGEPVWRRARLAASRRDRPAAAPARGRRVRRARRRRRRALPRTRRVHDPDTPRRRRLGGRGHLVPCPRCPRRRRPHPRARHPQGRWRAGRRVAVPAVAARGRVRAGYRGLALRPSRTGSEGHERDRSSPSSGRRRGIPYQRPEITLLFKSRRRSEKDDSDFDAVVPLLDQPTRWLRAASAPPSQPIIPARAAG